MKLIKQRIKLQSLYAKWPLTFETAFKSFRNKITSIIRSAKENYYENKLTDCGGDAKKTWKAINTLLGKSYPKAPPSLPYNGDIITNNYDMTKTFNEYFSSISNILCDNIQDSQHTFNTYLPEPAPYHFYLRPTTLAQIKSVSLNMKVSTPGHDEIHSKIIIECCDIISPFLLFIINQSFQEGTFPHHLQIARVVPVYKKGDNFLPQNYRPSSILPSFSEIFENVMAVRLTNYLTS